MKDYLGCLVPILLLLSIGVLMGYCDKKEEKQKEIQKKEIAELKEEQQRKMQARKIPIKNGEYGRYIENHNQIYPCFNLYSEKDSIKVVETRELPISIYSYNLSDTISIDTGYHLRECAAVFQSAIRSDTLDFCFHSLNEDYDIFLGDYYLDASQTSITWDELTKVTFIVKLSQASERLEFTLNREEFKQHFPNVIPHIIQKKLRKRINQVADSYHH